MPTTRSTILFTDVVSSTTLAQQIGDAAWARLLAAHDETLRSVVSAHGGITVKSTGDGMLATFAIPAQAVRAASAARTALAGLALTIRAGVHTGEIIRTDSDIRGIAVHLASRVADRAGADEVLASEAVRDMVAGSGLTFVDRGMQQLKGFAEPWRLFALASDDRAAGESAAAVPPILVVPMPSGLAKPRLLPCIGRTDLIRDIDVAIKNTAEAIPQFVLLHGEAGVGKTRLSSEVARAAAAKGFVVLYGRCDEGIAVSYQPFVEAIEQLAAAVPPISLRPLLGPHAGELTRLLPELPQLLPGLVEPITSEPETERYRLFQAVTDWLAASAETAPILLVIDDLHWAGDSTLRMLDHLINRLDRSRVCVLMTYRDNEVGTETRLSQTLAGLGRHESALTRLRVNALDAVDTAELVEAAAGHALDEETQRLAASIHEDSGGNPFVIGEVIRHLIDSEVLTRDSNGRWTVSPSYDRLDVPQSIRDLITHRVGTLPPDVGRLLSIAALIGSEFPLDVLREVGGEGADLTSMVEIAQQARLIDESDDIGWLRYRFSHALIQATLSERVSGVRRATTHAAIAQAYERLYDGRLQRVLPELARHWSAAAPAGHGDRALAAAARSAKQALDGLAFESARVQYVTSLELFDRYGGPPQTRVELLIGLAEARRHSGDPAYREPLEQAWTAARELADGPLLARAALACSRAYWSVLGAVDEPRVTMLTAAIDAIGDSDPRTRAILLAELGTELVWDPASEARYTALSDEAVALARALDDRVTLCGVLTRRLATVYGVSRAWERNQLVRESLDLATELSDPVLQVQAATHGLMNAVECGEHDQLEALRELLLRLAPTLGQPAWQYAVGYGLMDFITCVGTPADMRVEIAAMLAVGERLNLPEAPFMAGCQTGGMHWWRDTYEEVVDDIVPLVESLAVLPTMKTWLTAIYARLGRRREAQQLLDEIRLDGFSLPPDCNQGIAWAECVLAASDLRDRVAAADLLAILAPYDDLILANPLNAVGPAPRYLGLLHDVLDDPDSAEAAYAAAVTMSERMGGRMWLAHIELDWAELLVRHDRSAAAGAHARRARDLAVELDLPGILARADGVLDEGQRDVARARG